MSPVRSSAAKTLLDINAASESVPKNSRRPKPSCSTSIACPPRIDSTATSLHAEPVVIGVAVFAAGGGAHREQAHFRADPAAGTRGKGLADRAEVRAVGAIAEKAYGAVAHFDTQIEGSALDGARFVFFFALTLVGVAGGSLYDVQTIGLLDQRDVCVVGAHDDEAGGLPVGRSGEGYFGGGRKYESGKLLQQQIGHIPEVAESFGQRHANEPEEAQAAGGKGPAGLRIGVPLPLQAEALGVELVGIGGRADGINFPDVGFAPARDGFAGGADHGPIVLPLQNCESVG